MNPSNPKPPSSSVRRPSFPANISNIRSSSSGGRSASPSLAPATPAPVGWGLDSARVRQRMVQRLADGGITHPAVLEAMGRIERHRFVDSAFVSQAYEDTSLPIGLEQTISKPSVVARMIELLLGSGMAHRLGGRLGRVLEIGTGCGYQAAVLSCVAEQVCSVERLRGLHEKAQANLAPLGLDNIRLVLGDGMLGYAPHAPYSGIISAAGGQAIPRPWLEQLEIGGRLIAPTQHTGGQQVLRMVERTPSGWNESILEAVHFVPLKSGLA